MYFYTFTLLLLFLKEVAEGNLFLEPHTSPTSASSVRRLLIHFAGEGEITELLVNYYGCKSN